MAQYVKALKKFGLQADPTQYRHHRGSIRRGGCFCLNPLFRESASSKLACSLSCVVRAGTRLDTELTTLSIGEPAHSSLYRVCEEHPQEKPASWSWHCVREPSTTNG